MKVALNCLAVDPGYKGGVTTYTLGLLRGLKELRSDIHFDVYCTNSNLSLFEEFEEAGRISLRIYKAPSNWERAARRLCLNSGYKGIFEDLSNFIYRASTNDMSRTANVMYTPTTTFNAFNYSIKTLVSMHDIQQVHFPEFFTRTELKQRDVTYGLTATKANYFQASSEFIREDLLRTFTHLSPDQIVVINEGVDIEGFSKKDPVALASTIEKYNLPEKFLFFPAQLWPHKNHLTVLKALRKLKYEQGMEIPLILTGAKYSAADSIFTYCHENQLTEVKYLGLVPFEDLRNLYKLATYLITAVLYESSSLPILEAAASGTAIIASDTPPNRELGRKLQLNFFNPLDSDALALLLMKLWSSDENGIQSTHNLKAIHAYSWKEVARQYYQFFSNIN